MHALLHCLPAHGITFDVMLTEKEESSDSTGGRTEAIRVASKYNWMFMMDRAGADCANYEYDKDAAKWSGALDRHGWDRTRGTSSCISKMKDAKVKAVNFGVGYKDEHYDECHADIDTYLEQCERVAKFIREFGEQRFGHPEQNGAPSEY